ncbi:hypothetical protein MSPP1_002784 [Malassezia sp. CBS 17886]|nr:hypothetical protein MSPP1_002784 [Malassezia sp. CBS 17886]
MEAAHGRGARAAADEGKETAGETRTAARQENASAGDLDAPCVVDPGTFADGSSTDTRGAASPATPAADGARDAAAAGVLEIRDFAFPMDDERHRGYGSVLPVYSPSPLPSTGIFSVLYNFDAESDNELSVAGGMKVHVLRHVDGGWVLAQDVASARRGLVPLAYLSPSA